MNYSKTLLFFLFFLPTALYAQSSFKQTGKASYYADKFEGEKTANGEIYYHTKLTAAHLNLPFNTKVKVTNLHNKKSVIVRVNDRGPFIEGRIIDLSKAAAKKLDFLKEGIAEVVIEVIKTSQAEEEYQPEKESYVKPVESSVNNNIYAITANHADPKGYGIQIGSFKNSENVFKKVESVKRSFNRPVFVQYAYVNQNYYYRIIIGKFNNRNEAELLNKKINKKYPGSYVVCFENL